MINDKLEIASQSSFKVKLVLGISSDLTEKL